MTLERIENHIVERANTEASAIAAETRTEAEQVTSHARETADADYAEAIERLQNNLKDAFDREIGKLRGSHRIGLLKLKSRILDDVFGKASEKLLFSDEYWEVIRTQLRSIAGLSGKILCRDEHRETLGRMIEELNGEAPGKIAPLAEEPSDITGGFVFQGSEFDVDFSLDSLVEAFREKILPELAAKAFS